MDSWQVTFDPLWCHKGPLVPSAGPWQQHEKAPALGVKGDIFLFRVMNLNLFRSSSSLQDGKAGHDVTKGHCSVTVVKVWLERRAALEKNSKNRTVNLRKSATFNQRLMKPKSRNHLIGPSFRPFTQRPLTSWLVFSDCSWCFVVVLLFLFFFQCTTAIGFHCRFSLTPPAGQIHEPTLKFSLIVSNEVLHVFFFPKWTSILIFPEDALHPLQVFQTSLIYFIQNQIYSQISISITTSQPITTQNSPPPFFTLSSRLLQTSCWDDLNILHLI